MFYKIIYIFVGLILLAYVGEYVFAFRDDPREPTRLRSKVPLIGHVLGLIRHGPSYHSKLRYMIFVA